MISSRDLRDLDPMTRAKAYRFLAICEARGVKALIISTYRDKEAQDALFAKGRTTAGPRITNAKGGDSFHQYHCAFDAVPLAYGKPLWNVFHSDGTMLREWEIMRDAAAESNLEWAGNWKTFKEYDHFQFTDGKSLDEFRVALTHLQGASHG